jgi:hypothetical protein
LGDGEKGNGSGLLSKNNYQLPGPDNSDAAEDDLTHKDIVL